MYSEVKVFEEPLAINKILSEDKTEMSELQSAMLCGLIKEYKPRKLVEVGVAAGGTTAIILNCVSMLGLNTEVYSVDLSKQYYRDSRKQTGYLGAECKQFLNNKVRHKFLLGGYLPEYLDEIGKEIDFLILDTMHVLPGELLDFLAAFPYLKDGAVVVLHDIFLNQYTVRTMKFFATRVLLSSVAAEKMVGRGSDNPYNYIELGAFKITQDTAKYIENIFSALIINWDYILDSAAIDIYKEFFSRYYTNDLMEEFDMAIGMNKKSVFEKRIADKKGLHSIHVLLEKLADKENIFIYGCGTYGTKLYDFMEAFGIKIEGYVISDGQVKPSIDKRVEFISEIDRDKVTIVLGVEKSIQEQICGGVIPSNWIPLDEDIIVFLRNLF